MIIYKCLFFSSGEIQKTAFKCFCNKWTPGFSFELCCRGFPISRNMVSFVDSANCPLS